MLQQTTHLWSFFFSLFFFIFLYHFHRHASLPCSSAWHLLSSSLGFLCKCPFKWLHHPLRSFLSLSTFLCSSFSAQRQLVNSPVCNTATLWSAATPPPTHTHTFRKLCLLWHHHRQTASCHERWSQHESCTNINFNHLVSTHPHFPHVPSHLLFRQENTWFGSTAILLWAAALGVDCAVMPPCGWFLSRTIYFFFFLEDTAINRVYCFSCYFYCYFYSLAVQNIDMSLSWWSC